MLSKMVLQLVVEPAGPSGRSRRTCPWSVPNFEDRHVGVDEIVAFAEQGLS